MPVNDIYGQLPGRLQEAVLVTPRDSRAHKFKYTSPGGMARDEEYVSPAGLQQLLYEERSACMWADWLRRGVQKVMLASLAVANATHG